MIINWTGDEVVNTLSLTLIGSLMDVLFYIVVGFVLITLALLGFVTWKIGRRKLSKNDRLYVQKSWEDIVVSETTNPRMAIIEADKLLDHTLGRLRFTGSLGEKLRASEKLYSDLDGVWNAHKLRNRIVHEVNFIPTQKQVKIVMQQYRRALNDLHAL